MQSSLLFPGLEVVHNLEWILRKKRYLLFRDDISVVRNMDLLLSWFDTVSSMHDEGEGIVHCCWQSWRALLYFVTGDSCSWPRHFQVLKQEACAFNLVQVGPGYVVGARLELKGEAFAKKEKSWACESVVRSITVMSSMNWLYSQQHMSETWSRQMLPRCMTSIELQHKVGGSMVLPVPLWLAASTNLLLSSSRNQVPSRSSMIHLWKGDRLTFCLYSWRVYRWYRGHDNKVLISLNQCEID